MTRYHRCPFCEKKRVMHVKVHGVPHRICFACFRVQYKLRKVTR